MNTHAFVRAAAALLVSVAVAVAQDSTTVTHQWIELSRKGLNAIWVVRETGDVFISNGKTLHISRDQGTTWTRATEPQEKGRHFSSIGFDGDWEGQRVALFPIDSPVGWITLDGGKSWTSFAKPTAPQVRKHDGWTYGVVDWTKDRPSRYFAKEHHASSFWLSTDAGENWRRIESAGGYYGIGMGADGALLIGKTHDDKSRGPDGKPGIYRSTDNGVTWKLVREGDLNQKVKPYRYGQTMIWPTVEGLARSGDGGRTWAMMPESPKKVLFGPYFGIDDQQMLVVNEQGVDRTDDGGKSWRTVMPRDQMPRPIRDAGFGGLKPNFAWDHQRNILYATSMGVSLYKCQLSGAADGKGQ